MGAIFTERHNGGQTGTTPTSTAGTLLVVLSHRRNISQSDGHQRANIDTDFHGGRTAEDIYRCLTSLQKVLKAQFILLRF